MLKVNRPATSPTRQTPLPLPPACTRGSASTDHLLDHLPLPLPSTTQMGGHLAEIFTASSAVIALGARATTTEEQHPRLHPRR